VGLLQQMTFQEEFDAQEQQQAVNMLIQY